MTNEEYFERRRVALLGKRKRRTPKELYERRMAIRYALMLWPRKVKGDPYIAGVLSGFLGVDEQVLGVRSGLSERPGWLAAFINGVGDSETVEAYDIIVDLHKAREADAEIFDLCLKKRYGDEKAARIIRELVDYAVTIDDGDRQMNKAILRILGSEAHRRPARRRITKEDT